MNPLFYASALFTFLCGMGFVASIVLTKTRRATAGRLLEVTHPESVVQAREPSSRELKKKVLQAATWIRQTLGITHKAEMLGRFQSAGIVEAGSRDLYMAIRVTAPLLGVAAGAFFESKGLFMSLFGGIGYLGPDLFLRRATKARQKRIRLSLPDAIDLLVICVDAGLGMDQALMRVAQDLQTSKPDLYLEFQTINREQRAGKPRIEAWQSMAERTQLAEVESFVNMLTQTERFGTPIARALSGFADNLRQKRRQRAEELAAKTTIKIMFPLVFFIFPTLFIVLIGPAVINIMHGLGMNK